jgi:putative tryptophan/tyrosine transport system substrate-binding protein
MGYQSRRQFLCQSLWFSSLAIGLQLAAGCGVQVGQSPSPPKLPRVGYLSLGDSDTSLSDAFREGLRELGHVESETIAVDYRFLPDTWTPDQLRQALTELIALPVDVLVVRGAPATLAAKKATSTIPIVGPIMRDPVADGLVASLARPGGNVTGLTPFATTVYGKYLELLREVVPNLSRVGVLWDENDQSVAASYQVALDAASRLSLELDSLPVRAPEQLEGAFQAAIANGANGLAMLGSSMIVNQQARIIELAARYRLPAMFTAREAVPAGGLMAYGANIRDLFLRAATYVDRILRGANPADLPVERPTKFDFAINLRTAETLGLTIPRSVLLQATELVQ